MAAGRTIVSADLPVIREVLNEKNAVFCEPDILENWRIRIDELLSNEARRVELGNQARRDVESYTWVAREQRVLEAFD